MYNFIDAFDSVSVYRGFNCIAYIITVGGIIALRQSLINNGADPRQKFYI